ncbi:MAG: hypothetical protein IJ708_06065 [Clostridia bacterium]|nr:hypothetical protein [Clostridia bacterium]
MTERISYPWLGEIFPGDYMQEIPYEAYLKDAPEVEKSGNVYDVTDFGAVPGSLHVQTEALQKALDACAQTGGTVYVPEGSYISGTLLMGSHTTLHLAPGASLIASRNIEDLIHPELSHGQDFGEESSGGAFLCVLHAEDVRITGGGTIHGQGEYFVHLPRKLPTMQPVDPVRLPTREEIRQGQINTAPGSIRTAYRERIRYAEDKYGEGKETLRRPSFMVWCYDAKRVEIDHVVLRDSMCWTLHMDRCDAVKIHDLVIDDNRHVANTDGIDLSGCQGVEIRHCFVSCADDGLCLKNTAHTGREMRNVEISECTVVTVMNAFKIGTGTRFPIRHVRVHDCTFMLPDIHPGSVSGISIESCDGSVIEDVEVRNIRMQGVQCPLYVLLNRRNEAGLPYSDDSQDLYWGGAIRNVTVQGITALDCDLPCIVTGYADATRAGAPVRRAIEGLKVEDMTMRYREAEEIVQIPECFEEQLTDYPESNAHGDVDACGIWVRHADGVTIRGLEVTPRRANTRPPVVFLDCNEAEWT